MREQTFPHNLIWIGTIFVIVLAPQLVTCQLTVNNLGEFYSKELIDKYGQNTRIDSEQVEGLIKAVQRLGQQSAGHGPTQHGTSSQMFAAPYAGNCSGLSDVACLRSKCLSTASLFAFLGLGPNDGATVAQLSQVSPGLLYHLQNPECYNLLFDNTSEKKQRPTPGEVWGYGFIAVTIINVAACLGILFYPIMKTNFYRRILMCMVGLAVGTLSASAILVLIPETFELMSDESHVKDIYIWRALVVIGGLYFFFTLERFLNAILIFQKKRQLKKKGVAADERAYNNPAFDNMNEISVTDSDHKPTHNEHGHSHGVDMTNKSKPVVWAPLSSIKSVAWMIIFGDALHNFVDGLSIGAAFSENTLAGISLSLAILCEELPHELGDFAILLASGMGVCQALLMNFVSALTCYVGLVIGIQVGAMEQGALWIFAVAGGMFLYISLVDMLPEMNEQARAEEERGGNRCVVYLLQNFGLLLGWAIILMISLYGGEISFG